MQFHTDEKKLQTIKARYSTDFDELRLGETFFDVAPIAKPQ